MMIANAGSVPMQQPPDTGYSAKPQVYFAGERLDIVELMAAKSDQRVLEIGCGSGATGVAALKAGKASDYVGVEIDPNSAEIAQTVLSRVILGNVETLDIAEIGDGFDVLIMSEVLEHLVDPWATLARLSTCLKPGAFVYASSPNIAHRGVITDLIRGRFRYEDVGVMDRTHLRWFTPEGYGALFEQAGFKQLSLGPIRPFPTKVKLFNHITGNRFSHLFTTQLMFVGQKPA